MSFFNRVKAIGRALEHKFVDRKGSTMTGALYIATAEIVERRFEITYSRDDAISGFFQCNKDRDGSVVQDGDQLIQIIGRGYDGDEYLVGARIRFLVDGTPGDDDMPGRIDFYTTPDGSDTDVLNMSILPDGGIMMQNLKSGATQVAAGAAAGELWVTSSHASLPDNVIMIGA